MRKETSIQCFSEGETNTRFFHSLVKGEGTGYLFIKSERLMAMGWSGWTCADEALQFYQD